MKHGIETLSLWNKKKEIVIIEVELVNIKIDHNRLSEIFFQGWHCDSSVRHYFVIISVEMCFLSLIAADLKKKLHSENRLPLLHALSILSLIKAVI